MTPSTERMRKDLIRIRYELAARKFATALEKQALLRAKYNPMQPRLPAGNPGGGQWTSGGYQAGSDSSSGFDSLFGSFSEAGSDAGFIGDGGGSDFEFGSDNDPIRQVAESGAEATPEFSPDRRGFHGYTHGPNAVCAAELRCTEEEAKDFAKRFAVPGQDPEQPVKSGETYVVYDPRNGLRAGQVLTTISEDGFSIKNRTLTGHIFYDGQITRTITQGPDGTWYMTTRGIGNNVVPGFATINQWQGPKIFEALDQQMRQYIERKKRGQKFARREDLADRFSGLGMPTYRWESSNG